MKKVISLKLNKEFKRAYYQGKFKAHPLIITYMVKNHNRLQRIGITASKKIGCAVKRNRARRLIKQAFMELRNEGFIDRNNYYDFVFVARADTVKSKTKAVKEVMKKQVQMLQSGKVTNKSREKPKE